MVQATILSLLACCSAFASALPLDDHDESTKDTAAGSFASPANSVKPKFRYWFPDASIDPDLFADDITQLGERGAGGTEFLNYYNYGGAEGPAATDWTLYGYGTEAYLTLLKTGLQAHIENGLVFDYSMGPQSGQGVPAEADNPGLSWELVQYNTTINGSYDGTLPGWGEGDLISASTFAVINATNITSTGDSSLQAQFGIGAGYLQYTISNASLTDVTKLVGTNGSISVAAPEVDGADYYLLHASYALKSYARACIPSSSNPQNIMQNGSFAVDHFSATGAKVTTDFLEQYILIDGIKELLQEVGHYIWEDSVEIVEQTYWTPDLAETFEEQHGYSLIPYIPLLQGNEGDQAVSFGATIVTDKTDADAAFISDWRATMSYLLGTYYGHLTNWTHEYLGLEFSGQIGYNLPVDMLQNVPHVDAPEAETLSFGNYIDGFLQYSGPADLSGKQVISIELGADILETYSQTWTALLLDAKHGFSGGINQVVIHGATYSHSYPNTTWPGFTSFDYVFAGQHSRHQPAWDVGYSEALGYLSRVQWVLQSGVPKIDLVFWDKQTAQNAYPAPLYTPSDLIEAGFTYEYLSPENFALDNAYVQDKVFAPTRQAFKLLILRANDTLTPQGIDYLVKYAEAGFPIVISGGVPSTYATSNETAIAAAEATLQGILDLDNVYQVAYDGLAAEIASIGITPRSQVQSNGTWYTRWRETTDGDAYVFIYNDGNYSTGNITFHNIGTPYYLNAWTGEESQVAEYVVTDGFTTISFSLQKTETSIIKFTNSTSSQLETHVVSSFDAVLGFTVFDEGSHIQALVGASKASNISLSSGKTVTTPNVTVSPAYSLTNWNVTVEQWLPPDDFYDLETDAKKVNVTFDIAGPILSAWSEIDLNLANTSGIGYYSTSFQWTTSKALGAYITVPPAAHSLVGVLNGVQLSAFDITNPRLNVTPYLVNGTNEILLKSASTLWNAIIPYWSELQTGGISPAIPYSTFAEAGYGPSANGIIGEVILTPYLVVQII